MAECWICSTCGVQYEASEAPPPRCFICEDERQYVGLAGQTWTTPAVLRADDAGLQFRNGLRTHVVPWSEVKAFRYRPGDPWPFVVVRGPIEQRPLLGIQRSDRDLAEAHVADLRARLAEAYGVERPGPDQP